MESKKKTRTEYTYELVGRVNSKGKRTSQDEKYQGQYFYQLNVSIENKEVKKIFAFPSALENEAI